MDSQICHYDIYEVVNLNRDNREYKEIYKIVVYIIDYLQETHMHHILIFKGTIISVYGSKFSGMVINSIVL